MLSWLSQKGTAAIVEFPGVLYRGGAEQKIRQYMIDNNFVDTVIQLPPDLFFGTGIATCILVLKKNKNNNDILFIDATEEYVRNTNKNKLSDDNINNIISLIRNRTTCENKSYIASYDEVKENDYILSVNSYIKTSIENNYVDINELNKQIKEIVEKENITRQELDKIISELENNYDENM
jgi:type I restriction enzyme M protein